MGELITMKSDQFDWDLTEVEYEAIKNSSIPKELTKDIDFDVASGGILWKARIEDRIAERITDEDNSQITEAEQKVTNLLSIVEEDVEDIEEHLTSTARICFEKDIKRKELFLLKTTLENNLESSTKNSISIIDYRDSIGIRGKEDEKTLIEEEAGYFRYLFGNSVEDFAAVNQSSKKKSEPLEYAAHSSLKPTVDELVEMSIAMDSHNKLWNEKK